MTTEQKNNHPKMTATETMVSKFREPPVEFRGAPFWSWNAKLEPERLREQIRVMKQMGMGGFFMHSRVGLRTPYLGEEWFDCVAACIDQAKKEGMKAWLYDEDRWPSGFAGGIVTADDRFKKRELLAERGASELSGRGSTLCRFAARFDGDRVVAYRRLGDADAPKGSETPVRCFYDFAAKSSAFNGETYLDTLNDEAVRRFIDVTHEAYYRKFGSEFGKSIPGIFTDEPCFFLPDRGRDDLPWTVGFERKFEEKFGYDLRDGMIELFFDCGSEISRFRHDYYELLTELFVHAFARQIGEWCGSRRALFTGHVLWEDDLMGQTACVGDAMRFYEYMQLPGIDLLTEHWNTFATAKQCSSVARQLGKKRRLCELYGCTGWDFPLFAHKSVGDWLYATGINFRCHHLWWYSMEGEAKRDYPASISEHSPWHAAYSRIEDHFARVGAVISAGKEIRDILVVHPIESAWCLQYRVSGDGIPASQRLNREMIALSNRLLAANLDFDYGDEELLSRYASLRDGILTVGEAEYKAVVVPALKTIRSSTLELLREFAAAGGRVYCLGEAPGYVDAVKSDAAANAFAEFAAVGEEELTARLGADCRRVSLTDEKGDEIAPLLFHLSETDAGTALFVCNVGIGFAGSCMAQPPVRDRKLAFPQVRVAIAAAPERTPYEFDTLDGTIREIPFRYEEGRYVFETEFDELGSRLFVLAAERIPEAQPAADRCRPVVRGDLNGVTGGISRDEPNVFILDHADICIDGVKVKENEFFLLADNFLREKLGKPPRGGSMIQPYLQKDTVPAKVLDIRLEYTFGCDELPDTDCLLALEHPELYAISFNGTEPDPADRGYWIDPVLRLVGLPATLFRKGENRLVIRGKYHEGLPGLESLFILGEFGVFDGRIGKVPSAIRWGDWCEQGFPAYGGNLTYRLPLPELPRGRVFLNIPEWRGTALGVKINGSEEKLLLAPPYRLEMTDLVKRDGGDIAEIKVYGHRRNVFGPFYSLEKWPAWTGPAQFRIYETEERQTVPCGILAAPRVEMMEDL